MKKIHPTIGSATSGANSSRCINYIIETYMRSTYLYNSMILDDVKELIATYNEVFKTLF